MQGWVLEAVVSFVDEAYTLRFEIEKIRVQLSHLSHEVIEVNLALLLELAILEYFLKNGIVADHTWVNLSLVSWNMRLKSLELG